MAKSFILDRQHVAGGTDEALDVMHMNGVNFIIFGAILASFANSTALSQQMQQIGVSSAHTIHQPYNIETFGEFRKIMMDGDFTAKVHFDAVMARHPTTGIGALADARGEITILDGKLIVSYGKTGGADVNSESAALLAMGSVVEWQSVMVERDVAPSEIESLIAVAAKAHGVDPENSLPFEVRGLVTSYVMHINAAPTQGPHGMGLPMAITVEHAGDDPIDSWIAGLYVSSGLVGIATHGGERTHAHWVSQDQTSTAHLDRWGLKAGAVLLLPKPKFE
jgi:alpha-acetolactate decarboxylase